jgi:hypothetical protein
MQSDEKPLNENSIAKSAPDADDNACGLADFRSINVPCIFITGCYRSINDL